MNLQIEEIFSRQKFLDFTFEFRKPVRVLREEQNFNIFFSNFTFKIVASSPIFHY